jgi:hypothetical protein
MKMRSAIVMVGILATVAAVGIFSILPEGPVEAKGDKSKAGQVDIELMVSAGKVGSVGAMTAAVRNIGSSGQDGVKTDGGSFQVDSFFDIEYRVGGLETHKIETEMIAMQLRTTLTDPDNPNAALDDIKAAIQAAGGGVYYGHVTVLK